MAKYKGVANQQSLHDVSHIARCALDPRVMQSDKYEIKPATVKKNIAIIGGGIGGMEAAILLAKRGHKVSLYEKSDRLGGVFIAAAAPSYKEHDRMLIAWYEREIQKYPIDIHMNTEVKSIEELHADEVIVATGAKARKLPIPGIEKATEAVDFLLGDQTNIGENVVVIGGGLTGCEIAYDLYLHGKKPVIVEAKHDLIVSDKVPLPNASYLRDFFISNKVPTYLESSVKEIKDGSVVVTDKAGNTTEIKADNVIVSVGYIPTPVFEKSKHVHVIGDAKQVGSLRTVIWGAWDIGMKL